MYEVTTEVKAWAGVCIVFKKMVQWELNPFWHELLSALSGTQKRQLVLEIFSLSPSLGAWKP